jgi:hypothetical protein
MMFAGLVGCGLKRVAENGKLAGSRRLKMWVVADLKLGGAGGILWLTFGSFRIKAARGDFDQKCKDLIFSLKTRVRKSR